MKKSTILLLLTFFSFSAFAQSYDIAGGLRLGTEFGLTAKYRFAKRTCAEVIIQNGISQDETAITFLVEQHFPVLTRRLNMYFGGGVHKGWSNDSTYDNPYGITGIAGIDFTINRLNVSWDFKPAINIGGGSSNLYSQSAVSVRYVFKKRPTKVKKFLKSDKWKIWKKERWQKKE